MRAPRLLSVAATTVHPACEIFLNFHPVYAYIMNMNIRILLSTLLIMAWNLPLIKAQNNQEMANLIQDVKLLKEEVNNLKYEVKSLKRENQKLKKRYLQKVDSEASFAEDLQQIRGEMDRRLSKLRKDLQDASRQQRKQIVNTVTTQMKQFANDTQRAFDKLQQKVLSSQNMPAPGERTTFNDDFPKTGIEYTVQKGDNLWALAQEYDSKVDWIQNANKLESPGDLKVGQVLIIPQKD